MPNVAQSHSWLDAAAIGVLVASAAIIPLATTTAERTQQFVLEFEMAASKPTAAEIFVDGGAGLEPLTAITFAVEMSAEPRPYVMPLASGRYHMIRLDPFPDDGNFVLQHARVRHRYGRIVAALDLRGRSRVDSCRSRRQVRNGSSGRRSRGTPTRN